MSTAQQGFIVDTSVHHEPFCERNPLSLYLLPHGAPVPPCDCGADARAGKDSVQRAPRPQRTGAMLVDALTRNVDDWYAGRIDYDEFTLRQNTVWSEIRERGPEFVDDIHVLLKHTPMPPKQPEPEPAPWPYQVSIDDGCVWLDTEIACHDEQPMQHDGLVIGYGEDAIGDAIATLEAAIERLRAMRQ